MLIFCYICELKVDTLIFIKNNINQDLLFNPIEKEDEQKHCWILAVNRLLYYFEILLRACLGLDLSSSNHQNGVLFICTFCYLLRFASYDTPATPPKPNKQTNK